MKAPVLSPQAQWVRPRLRLAGWAPWAPWAVYALVLLGAPLLWRSSLSLTLLSQMGTSIIACLAFNMLLGQGGMLSFGHAVYSGIGAFFAMHALNLIAAGSLHLPVSLLPLVGGFFGLLFAALLGYVTTKKSGTPFAMITLGMGELVGAMALMFPGFFGGEGGISGDRTSGPHWLGISFGPQIQLYYLIAIYTFVCTAAMYAFTRTPLGRMLNAVRDNPERVAFVGYNTQFVRYFAFIASGFFMGVAGGLGALNFEIVTSEVVGATRSGSYLLFTFLGGCTVFFGPIIGAVLLVLALVLMSEITHAWLLYLGLVFTFMVMLAPGGIASLIMMNLRLASFGRLRPLVAGYLALGGSAAAALLGASAMIEMTYRLQLDDARSPTMNFLGLTLDLRAADSWFGAGFVLLVGGLLFELVRRQFAGQWSQAQGQIEREHREREAAL
jgi:branched-chain amino acid transport system permease protein